MPRLIIDIATDRVIYFTNDIEQVLELNDHVTMQDWPEPLPTDMSLNNCWNWCVRGNVLKNTTGAVTGSANTLLDQNKKNVSQLLINKINAVRQPYTSKYIHNDWIRSQRLIEARLVEAQHGAGPLLSAEAAIKNIEVAVLAKEVIDSERMYQLIMVKTETLKLKYQKAIDETTEESSLWQLRDEIANANYLA